MTQCPLTKTTDVKLLEKIPTSKLVALYDQFGINTRSYFAHLTHVKRYLSINTGFQFYYPFHLEGKPDLYGALEKFEWYYLKDKWEHLQALNIISGYELVLEVGCGYGAFLKMIKPTLQHEPVGLEHNPYAVESGKASDLKVYNTDIRSAISFVGRQFDTICFFQVLEHVADPLQLLLDAAFAITDKGKIIIAVPNNDALINKDKENALNYPPHHMGLWNEKSLRSMAGILNMRVTRVDFEPLQPIHFEWYTRTLLKRIFSGRLYQRLLAKTRFEIIAGKILRVFKPKGHSILVVFEK